MPESRPERIGRYEILGELGHGAMGVVYKAKDPNLDRVVAVKALRVDPGLPSEQHAELERRFLREAIAAGRLNHPNIVAVFDVVEVDRVPYIVMECVDGRTLADLIASGERRPSIIIGLALQICSALDYAHGRGIVHRDVKPSNILVTEAGQVKVSDFGIARIAGSKVTQTGAMLGTPAYMSPEQISGREVDGRSDLFSLGLVLYEAISGRDAFKADDPTAVLYQIVHEEPTPIRELVPSVSPALDGAIRRVLAKQPDRRYQTAGAFADALRSTLEMDVDRTIVMNAPGPATRRPTRAARPAMVLGGLALIMIVIGGGTVLWMRRSTMDSPTLELASAKSSTPPGGSADTPAPAVTQSPESPKPDAPASEGTRGSSANPTGSLADKGEERVGPSRKPEGVSSRAPEPTPSVPRIPPAVQPQDGTTQAGTTKADSTKVAPAAASPARGRPAPASPAPKPADRPPRSPAPRTAGSAPASPAAAPAEQAPPFVPGQTGQPAASPAPLSAERPTASLAEPATRSAAPTPDEIKARVATALRSSDKLSGVAVEVTPRLGVHLTGRVWDEDAQRLAVKLAGSVNGVTEVTQNIAVAMKEMNQKFNEAVQGGTIRRTP